MLHFYKQKQTVCRWIKLKRWAQSFVGSREEAVWKIKIFCISSIRIRYFYSSQVDPECSGWLNTIAAFFVCFHNSHFSTFLFFAHQSRHIMHNHTNTHTQFVTLLPDFTSFPSSTTLTYVLTFTHTLTHTNTHLFPGSCSSFV